MAQEDFLLRLGVKKKKDGIYLEPLEFEELDILNDFRTVKK